ncbi:MAG: pilin [Enterovibrio sp.]
MRKQSGFSLIELMIVVAVIGVLTAIALPAYQNYTKKAELSAALASINSIKTNVEENIANFNTFPKTGDADEASNTVTHVQLGLKDDAFTFGTWAATRSGDNPVAGSLTITFNTKSSIGSGSTLSLTRSEKGLWSCLVEIKDTPDPTYLPNNCTVKKEATPGPT